MKHQPTTICKDREHFPAVILPSGKTRILTDVGFYSEAIAMSLATDKVSKGYFKKLTTKRKVDVNLESHSNVKLTGAKAKTHTQPDTIFDHHDRRERLAHEPTTFANSAPHQAPVSGLLYTTPDVHDMSHSHGTLDHMAVPGALPDQSQTTHLAIELCRLFNVNTNHVQMQNKPTTTLDAWDEGSIAAQGGKGKRSCPYVKGGVPYYDWMDGFNSYQG